MVVFLIGEKMDYDVLRRMEVGTRLLLIVGMLALGTAIDAHADEFEVDDGPIEIFSGRPEWSERQIIVKFAEDITDDHSNAMIQQYGCSLVRRCSFANLRLLEIPEFMTPEEMVDIIGQNPLIDYAELNHYAWITFFPDDTFYSFQWHLDNPISGGIGMETAWDIQTGDPNVVVAVLDTGVAYEDFGVFRQAPDLAGTLFVPGYDFVNDDAHPNDDEGHGTHVTGTIAQSTNNGAGVAGVAFGCSIMPVKVISRDGFGSHFDIAEGIYFAARNGARVINMSLGGNRNSATLRDAVAFAYSQGVTVVCAAGNEFLQGSPPSYPAAYDKYCIAVGATRYDETRAFYSNTGRYVDVVAPGGDVNVDQDGDGFADGVLQQTFRRDPSDFRYFFFQGTSMAAPHVSGAAALLVSNGITDPDMIHKILEATAKDLGPAGWDEAYGWGLIDVGAALNLATAFDEDKVINLIDLAVKGTEIIIPSHRRYTTMQENTWRARAVSISGT